MDTKTNKGGNMKVEMKRLRICGHCQKWQTVAVLKVPFTGNCPEKGKVHHDATCPAWAFGYETAPHDEEQVKKIRRVVEDTLRKGAAAQIVETAIRLGVVVDL
jgi:hypothetical protein